MRLVYFIECFNSVKKKKGKDKTNKNFKKPNRILETWLLYCHYNPIVYQEAPFPVVSPPVT